MAFMKSLYHRMLDSRIDGSRIDVDLGNGDGRHKYQLTSYRDELYILHRFYQGRDQVIMILPREAAMDFQEFRTIVPFGFTDDYWTHERFLRIKAAVESHHIITADEAIEKLDTPGMCMSDTLPQYHRPHVTVVKDQTLGNLTIHDAGHGINVEG